MFRRHLFLPSELKTVKVVEVESLFRHSSRRMRSIVWIGVLLTFGISVTEGQEWMPNFLGQTPIKHPAFIEVFQSEDDSLSYEDRWKLFLSTFDALALGEYDEVYYMKSPGNYLDSVSSWSEEQLVAYDQSAYWPNGMNYMPSSVVGVEGIVQTSGFLVPTKKDGKLQLYDTTVDPPSLLTNIAEGDSDEWSYHRVHWQDMDLDGDLDAVTVRFHLPNVGDVRSEFLWLENPGTGPTPSWTEHVISTDGPDVHFDTATLSAGGKDYDVFVFGEFFKQRISLYWTENENNDWTDDASINSRIVNPASGQTFEVFVDDFNKDGSLEFLASEYDPTAGEGRATIYFFPPDFRTDNFESTVIADGFIPNVVDDQHMSPGSPKTYYPSAAYAAETAEDGLPHKPWILLSGDDDGKMYILYPTSDVRDDWTYDKNILIDTEASIIGKMASADVDGDGYEEIIVAGYSAGNLYVYSYAPSSTQKFN